MDLDYICENMRKISLHYLMIIFVVYSGMIFSLENEAEAKSREEIIQLLQKWPKDFNAKNIGAVCELFAPNLVASYPGTLDRNYEEMCRHLTAVLTQTDKIFHYDPPLIEQVIIEGNLAVIRLIWTLKISSKNGTETIKEKGLDVFMRQNDGKWKIAISYAFPNS